MVRRVLLAMLAAGCAMTCAETACAAGFSSGPAVVTIEVPPGGSTTTQITIRNGEEVPLSVTAVLDDWWLEEGRTVLGAGGGRPESAVPWTLVPPGEQVLVPGQTAVLPVYLQPPVDATGSYYAAVRVGAAPVTTGDAPQAGAVLSIVTLLLVRIEGTGTESVRLSDVAATPPTDSTPLHVTGRLSCDGDVHSVLRPTALVVDSRGQTVARIDGQDVRIMPGQAKTIDLAWGGRLEPDTFQVFLTGVYGAGKTASASGTLTIGP